MSGEIINVLLSNRNGLIYRLIIMKHSGSIVSRVIWIVTLTTDLIYSLPTSTLVGIGHPLILSKIQSMPVALRTLPSPDLLHAERVEVMRAPVERLHHSRSLNNLPLLNRHPSIPHPDEVMKLLRHIRLNLRQPIRKRHLHIQPRGLRCV